jgi:ubiquinone/menaquinone biosynthesis C-methylase UbiE
MEMKQQLGKEQYVNADKFNARIYLNTKFRTNQYPWPAWVFDQFEKQENLKILELGCGNGLLWMVNARRVPNTWEITLSDYSRGMLDDAQKNLADIGLNLKFMVISAEDINLSDKSFDLVIANHMLYHITNRKKALSDIRRVLKNDGVFYATTVSIKNMHELRTLAESFIDNPIPTVVSEFSLENGKEQLENYFSNIEIRKYDDSLEITEANAIVNYFLSFNGMTEGKIILKEEQIDEFSQYIAKKIENQGKIFVSKDTGIFICRK